MKLKVSLRVQLRRPSQIAKKVIVARKRRKVLAGIDLAEFCHELLEFDVDRYPVRKCVLLRGCGASVSSASSFIDRLKDFCVPFFIESYSLIVRLGVLSDAD